MATNHWSASDPPGRRAGSHSDTEQPPGLTPSEYLELLGDEYTRCVLQTLLDGPRTGREITDATDISKPTVYRRLARLEEAGLVATTQKIDGDGHHCKEFHVVVETLDVQFGRDGIDVSVETDTGRETRPDDRLAVAE